VDLVEGPLLAILELLPPQRSPIDEAASRLQAFYRGQTVRFCGRGRVKKLSPPSRTELMKSLDAKATVIIGEGSSTYPMLLRVRPNWKGEISRIKIFNLRTDASGLLVLKTQFRLPLGVYDPSYHYSLTLSCSRLNQPSSPPHNDSDSEEEESSVIDSSFPPKEESPLTLYLIVIKFAENETGLYLLRQLYLSLSEDGTLTTIETSTDVYCPRNHNPSLLELPDYVEDSTQKTEEEPSVDDLPLSSDELTSVPEETVDLQGESTIENSIDQLEDESFTNSWEPSVDAESSWDPTLAGEGSAESLMNLFTPYRPRRGLYRHFGTLYLFNVMFVSNTNSSTAEVLSTPSARAMHEAHRIVGAQSLNTLHIRCLQVNDGKRLLFILPPRLAVMENLDDVFPILLGSVQAMTGLTDTDTTSSDPETVLTPRRHGISLLDGALELLVNATQSPDGEIIVRLAIAQPHQLPDSDEIPVHSEEEFVASVRKVLTVHQNKNQAWNQLQDHVCRSFDLAELLEEEFVNESSSLSRENESEREEAATTEETPQPVRSPTKEFRRGGTQVGDHFYLYNVTFQENENLLIRLQCLPEDEAIVYLLPPRRSTFENHIDALLQILALNSHRGTKMEIVPIETRKDSSKNDLEYLDAVKEFLDPPQLGIPEISRSLVKSWIEQFVHPEEVEPPVLATPVPEQSMSAHARSPNEIKPSIEKQVDPLPEVVPNTVDQANLLNNEMTEDEKTRIVADIIAEQERLVRLFIADFVESITNEAVRDITAQVEEACRHARDAMVVELIEQWLEVALRHVLEEEIQQLEAQSLIQEQSQPVTLEVKPEVTLDTSPTEVISDLPCLSLDDLLDPLEGELDATEDEAFRSPPSSMAQPVNVQAAFFLAFQGQRLACLDYLADRAAKAKHQVTRQHAFEYLKECAENAQEKLDHRHPHSLIARKHSTSLKKKVFVNDSGPEIITSLPSRELDVSSPLDSKGNRKMLRQYSAQHIKDRPPKEKRRGTTPPALASKILVQMPPSPEVEYRPNSAEQLHQLLDLQLKDESFAERPQDLIEALQSLSTTIPVVCASPPFLALSRSFSPPPFVDPPPRQYSVESEKVESAFSLRERSSPSKPSEWDSKIETMKSANGLAPIGMGKRNPIDFLDESQANTSSNPMFEESISDYLQKGYSTGTCAYLAIWKNKIIHCVKSFPNPMQLDKAIYSLQRAYPEPLTRAGALCALSETNGSVGEALGHLNDKTFKHELILVCQALPVDELVNRLSEYKKQHRFPSSHDRTIDDLLIDTQIMRNTSRTGTGTGTRGGTLTIDAIAAQSSSLHEHPPSNSNDGFRFPSAISRSLPHHGMVATSPTVLSRGNLVKRIREHVKGGSTNTSMTVEPTLLPPIGKTTLSKSLGALPTQTEQPTRDATSGSTRRSKAMEYKLQTAKKVATEQQQHSSSSHTPRLLAHGGGTAPPKFTRVGRTIDVLAEQSDTLVVMSRLNAYRAQEEELLLKYHPEQDSYFRSSRQKKVAGTTRIGGGGQL
jgi:hypothetical protein